MTWKEVKVYFYARTYHRSLCLDDVTAASPSLFTDPIYFTPWHVPDPELGIAPQQRAPITGVSDKERCSYQYGRTPSFLWENQPPEEPAPPTAPEAAPPTAPEVAPPSPTAPTPAAEKPFENRNWFLPPDNPVVSVSVSPTGESEPERHTHGGKFPLELPTQNQVSPSHNSDSNT